MVTATVGVVVETGYHGVITLGMNLSALLDRLIGLVVKASASRSRVRVPFAPWEYSGLNHTGDLKIGTPVATLPGAWRYRD